MAEPEQPQLYLITPPAFDPDGFRDILSRLLDQVEIACVRLDLATRDEDAVARAADALREAAHARDVALVIADHVMLAERLGLDGVHLSDAARSVRAAKKTLGADAIVGSFCGTSRHDGMTAGEAGADYVSFGPVGASTLGDGAQVEQEVFEWWSQMIEIPVVAEGALTPDDIRRVAPFTDFIGIGAEIWDAADPVDALKGLRAAIG